MSSSYLWILAIHVIGFVMWVGALVGLSTLLSAHRRLAESTVDELVGLERKIALEMDIGALIAITCGVAMILKGKNMGDAWVMKQGWMHVKLTMVIALLASHVIVRVKVAKARRGDRSGLSPIVPVVVGALFVGIVIMGVARPIGGA